MMNLTTVEYPNAVPTATPAGTCSARIRIGAVMVPAPTPVRAMMTAIMNPIRYSIAIGAPPGFREGGDERLGPIRARRNVEIVYQFGRETCSNYACADPTPG